MMKALRIVRWTSLALVVLLALGIGVLKFAESERSPAITDDSATASADAMSVPAGVAVGGPFHLIDETGRPVSDADYRGRWMLVFFGYTNCPDECPLTLQKMATALRQLGPLAGRVAPLFITVDPSRDTPARLASYLKNFDPRIVGLTGSSEQIAEAAKVYRVYYSPAEHEQSGVDLINHSAFLYLMGPDGKLAALFSADITAERLAAALRERLSAQPSRPT
jgi:cytochrome oxidase Cu insertion factor (SCO1/SenC/PrrC family)